MRALTAAALLLAVPTHAVEVAGVNVPATFSSDGATLALNGAGLRVKTVVFVKAKVYVAALYLPRKMTDATAIVALDEPKAVRMVFLRNVDRSSVLGAFRDGFEANSPAQAPELLPKLKLLEPALPDEIKEGQVLVVAYAPGRGSTVGIEGGKPAVVAGKEFADALFRNWLGPKPADGGLEDLREALLGQSGGER
ncbi:MAG TPA: chalcone isomerase family protein [Anaeromyxobacteraceae bacterium]|nr:chalcone isomerase family protein [Anaeromyxobacteraceae bacterium]